MIFKSLKRKLIFYGVTLGLVVSLGIGAISSFTTMVSVVSINGAQNNDDGGGFGDFTGGFTPTVPKYSEIKGEGQISDRVAQLAVGTAVKYHLLPSVILSQYAYESSWGKAPSGPAYT
ncbi:glucosaminidase domain-containing protein [Lactococcus garvieae]|uniref:glucosaminidase domain-containing protein n=1 Tax=Lactococcus garvieae TaxID=1363 RepID=UPI0002E74F75